MEKTFASILSDYRPMIFSIIQKYNLKAGDFQLPEDDLFQEGCIALYNAYTNYQDDFDAKFSTYAFTLVSRRIDKKLHEFMRPLIHESKSLDCVGQKDYLEFYAMSHMSKYNGDEERFNKYRQITSEFLKTIPEEDAYLLRLRESNITYKEICALTKLNQKQIDNKLYRIRIKYKKYANKSYRKIS